MRPSPVISTEDPGHKRNSNPGSQFSLLWVFLFALLPIGSLWIMCLRHLGPSPAGANVASPASPHAPLCPLCQHHHHISNTLYACSASVLMPLAVSAFPSHPSSPSPHTAHPSFSLGFTAPVQSSKSACLSTQAVSSQREPLGFMSMSAVRCSRCV